MISKVRYLTCLIMLCALFNLCISEFVTADSSVKVTNSSALADEFTSPQQEAQTQTISQSSRKELSFWLTLKKSIINTFEKNISSYLLLFLGMGALLSIGMLFNDVLHFIYTTKPFKSLLWPPFFKAWIARLVGKRYFRRSLKSNKRQKNDWLVWFRRGQDILQEGKDEAEKSKLDTKQFLLLLANPLLAPLYALSAWDYAVNGTQNKKAIDEADFALQINPDIIDARIARGWAKLQRNGSADIGEAQSDFQEVNRIGEKRKLRYLYALYGYGETLRLQGDNTKALEQYNKAMTEDATQIPGLFAGRGMAYYGLGNWEKSFDDLNAALSSFPNHPWASIYLADILIHLERFDNAVEECKKIIKKNPSNQQAHYVLGIALYKQSQTVSEISLEQKFKLLQEAAESLQTAKGIAIKNNCPGTDIYVQLGEVLAALGKNDESQRCFLEARTRQIPTSSVLETDKFAQFTNQFIEEARLRFYKGFARVQVWAANHNVDTEMAVKELSLADEDFIIATTYPNSAAAANSGRAWVKYCQYLSGKATLDDALSFTRLALEQDSTLGLAHFVRGWIMFMKGLYTDAKAEFIAAIERSFDISGTYYGLGEAERLLSNFNIALDAYTNAIEKACNASADAWCALYGRALVHGELLHWRSAWDDYHAAIEHTKKLSVPRSQLAELYAGFAWACYEIWHDVEMEETFKAAIDFDQKSEYVLLQLGGVHLYCNRYKEALKNYSRAIEIYPASSQCYASRGLTQIYSDNLGAALDDLDNAIKKNNNDSYAWLTRGWARMRNKEWEKAITDLNKAIELSVDEPFSFNDRALTRWWLEDSKGALNDLRKLIEIKVAPFAGKTIERVREDAFTWGATEKDWTSAVEKNPKDYIARLGRGISRCLAGDKEGAIEDLNFARKCNIRSKEVKTVIDDLKYDLSVKAT